MRYVAVARLVDKVTIADFIAFESRDIPAKLLEDKRERVLHSGRIGDHYRLTITDKDVGTIHYDSDPVCVYIVVCSREYQQRTAFKFLVELRREFDARYGNDINNARHSTLSKPSRELFRSLCDKYNTIENVDKVASVSMQVEEVKGVMQNNIQSVLRNQENIETLLDQTDTMKNQATDFQRTANRAKDKMWWKNVKMQMIIVVLVILIVIALIVYFTVRGNKKTPAAESSEGS